MLNVLFGSVTSPSRFPSVESFIFHYVTIRRCSFDRMGGESWLYLLFKYILKSLQVSEPTAHLAGFFGQRLASLLGLMLVRTRDEDVSSPAPWLVLFSVLEAKDGSKGSAFHFFVGDNTTFSHKC